MESRVAIFKLLNIGRQLRIEPWNSSISTYQNIPEKCEKMCANLPPPPSPNTHLEL